MSITPTSSSPNSSPTRPKIERRTQFLRLVDIAVDNSNKDQWILLCKNWEDLTTKGIDLPKVVNDIFSISKTKKIDDFIHYCEDNGALLQNACRPASKKKLNFELDSSTELQEEEGITLSNIPSHEKGTSPL